MCAELFDLQPFCGVASVLLGGIARDTWRAFVGVGPAFSALKSDHYPDALVFSHKGRSAEGAKGNNKGLSYKATYQVDDYGCQSVG